MMSIYLVTQGCLLLVAGCAMTSTSGESTSGLAAGYGTLAAGVFLILWAPFA